MQKKLADNEEIDLMDLLVRIFSAFANNLILTIALPLLGMIFAYLLSSTSFEKYESKMMLVSNLMSATECEFIIEQFQKADTIPGLDQESRAALTKLSYKVTTEKEYHQQHDEANYNVQLGPPVYLELTAYVNDRSAFAPLQRALVNYLNTSKPVEIARARVEEHYEELIKKIDQELEGLEKAKTEGKATYLDPMGLYKGAVDLYEKKVSYQLSVKDIQTPVKVTQGFTSMTMNAKLPTIYTLGIGFLVGFLILCMVLFIKFFYTYYKQRKNQPE